MDSVGEEHLRQRIMHAHRAGSIHGDNTKLRCAYELDVPIILLHKIENSIYVPIFPV